MVKNSLAMQGFNPWVRKIPWKREWLTIPVFLSEEFHAQRSLVGCSPCGSKELDMTEQLTLSLFLLFGSQGRAREGVFVFVFPKSRICLFVVTFLSIL